MTTQKRRIRLRRVTVATAIEIPPEGESKVIELDLEPDEYIVAINNMFFDNTQMLLARDVTPSPLPDSQDT